MLKRIYVLSCLFIIGSSLHAGFADKAMQILRTQGPKKFQELIIARFKFNQAAKRIEYAELSSHKSKEAHICDIQTTHEDLKQLIDQMSQNHTMPLYLKKTMLARIAAGMTTLGTTAYLSPSIDTKLDTPFCFTAAGAIVGGSFLNSAFQGYKEEVIERNNTIGTVKNIEKKFHTGLFAYLRKTCKYNPGVARTLIQRIIK